MFCTNISQFIPHPTGLIFHCGSYYYGVTSFFGVHRLRPKKLSASVAVPEASFRVPSQRPLAPSVSSVTSVRNINMEDYITEEKGYISLAFRNGWTALSCITYYLHGTTALDRPLMKVPLSNSNFSYTYFLLGADLWVTHELTS